MNNINVEISIGELIDKITILELKILNIKEEKKIINVKYEHKILIETLEKLNIDNEIISKFKKKLFDTNNKIWEIENNIREKERRKEFDSEFIEIARSVYMTNDIRASIKKQINEEFNSSLVEEKSYTDYNIK